MTAVETTRTPRIALLLDRSGSMASCRENALAGVNRYLREVADDPALIGGRITLLTFDSGSIDTVRDDVPLAICPSSQSLRQGCDSRSGGFGSSVGLI